MVFRRIAILVTRLGVGAAALNYLIPAVNALPGVLRPLSAMLIGEIVLSVIGVGFLWFARFAGSSGQ